MPYDCTLKLYQVYEYLQAYMYIRLRGERMAKIFKTEEGTTGGGKGGRESIIDRIFDDWIADTNWIDGRENYSVNSRHRWKRKLSLIGV